MTNPTHVTCDHCGFTFITALDNDHLCFRCTHCSHVHFLDDSRGRFPGYYTGNPNKGCTAERMNENMIVCKEIRKVQGGYIVEMTWPHVTEYADTIGSYGEVVCKTFEEVVALLARAADEEESKAQKEGCCGN